MGVYLTKPNTTKQTDDGGDVQSQCSRFGVSAMQGWRRSMEDAHVALPELALSSALPKLSMYGVFDGHGGVAVSEWVSRHFTEIVASAYQEVEDKLRKGASVPQSALAPELPDRIVVLAEALQRTFLAIDEKLQDAASQAEIDAIHMSQIAAESSSDSGFGGTGPEAVLQALMRSHPAGAGAGPLLRLIDDSQPTGRRFLEIVTGEENPQRAGEEPEEDANMEDLSDAATSTGGGTASAPDAATPSGDELPAETANSACSTEVSESPAAAPKAALDEDAAYADALDEQKAKDKAPFLMRQEGAGDRHIADHCGAAAIVCALVGGVHPFLLTANAGDSRAVLCRGGNAVGLSMDHKPCLAYEAERIWKAGGRVINGRVDGNLNLTRTLGDLCYKQDATRGPEFQRITALPDVRVLELHREDEFLILACDGIWDCVSNQEAVDFIRPQLYADGANPDSVLLSTIASQLCDKCLCNNPMQSDGGVGCDNMTCLIVHFGTELKSGAATGSAGTAGTAATDAPSAAKDVRSEDGDVGDVGDVGDDDDREENSSLFVGPRVMLPASAIPAPIVKFYSGSPAIPWPMGGRNAEPFPDDQDEDDSETEGGNRETGIGEDAVQLEEDSPPLPPDVEMQADVVKPDASPKPTAFA